MFSFEVCMECRKLQPAPILYRLGSSSCMSLLHRVTGKEAVTRNQEGLMMTGVDYSEHCIQAAEVSLAF